MHLKKPNLEVIFDFSCSYVHLSNCQAQQASTQLKLSFALFSLSPTTHPATRPPTRESIIYSLFSFNVKSNATKTIREHFIHILRRIQGSEV